MHAAQLEVGLAIVEKKGYKRKRLITGISDEFYLYRPFLSYDPHTLGKESQEYITIDLMNWREARPDDLQAISVDDIRDLLDK